MMWRDVIDLLTILPDGTEVPRQVMANKKSVRQSEFYQAPADGLKPSIMFEIWCAEYADEMVMRHEGKLYYVLRTYSPDGELYEMIGGLMVLPHTVTIIYRDPNTIDRHGRHPVVDEVERSCRIQQSSKVTRDRTGAEVVSHTQFVFPGWYKVAHWDELEWTDAMGDVKRKSPISIDLVLDQLGNQQFLVVNC